MIAEETFGFCSTQAMASCGHGQPGLLGERLELLHPGQHVVGQAAAR